MATAFKRSNPSPRYRELISQYQQLHLYGDVRRNIPPEKHYDGHALPRHAKSIKALVQHFKALTILDYGSGKGKQYTQPITLDDGQRYESIPEYWDVDSLTCYDPGYEPFSGLPEGTFDGVISTDVMEHVAEDDLEWVVEEMFSLARKFLFVNAASYEAFAHLPNGENAHCTVRPVQWWQDLMKRIGARHPEVRYFMSIDFRDGTPPHYRDSSPPQLFQG